MLKVPQSGSTTSEPPWFVQVVGPLGASQENHPDCGRWFDSWAKAVTAM